jgi:hypothetical protein
MNKAIKYLVVLALVALCTTSAVIAQSDDERVMATCDATLVTLLLVAIENYDYQPPQTLDQYAFGPYSDKSVSSEPEAPTVREQAEARVAEAAQTVGEGGFPGIAREIGELSDTVGDIAEMGSNLIDAGQAAFEAGRDALEGTESESVGEMTLGALPGESDVCTELRRDLVNFLFMNLTEADPE